MKITDLWKDQPGKYFFVCTKSGSGKWADHEFARKNFDKVAGFIAANRDKDLYFCPHGFDRPARLKKYAVDPLMLYADLDEVQPRKITPRPTIALESSPGRFVGFWKTTEPVSEELNRRLTYSLGSDVSGWDRTQVLRIPSTRNYKYESAPRVKLLWENGPLYNPKELEKQIPDLAPRATVNEEAVRVYKKYEKKLPQRLRHRLMNKTVSRGKRSEVLWRLQNELLETGMSRDEAFALLWVSPWNKFADRPDGANQLWAIIDKTVDSHLSGEYVAKEKENGAKWNPLPRPLSEVEEESVDWVVPGMFARKEVTIVEGDPSIGKSYFVQMVAGALCDGKKIPCEDKRYEPVKGSVVYFDTENTPGSVTKPRLVDNGVAHLENFWPGEEPFSVDDDEKWATVEEHLERVRPVMAVFDTVNIYMGSVDTYRSSETQQAMTKFKMLANRFDMSVVIIRHLTKSSGGSKAMYRGQGSIAFTGAARIVLTVGQSPDDEDTRVVACTKMNLGRKPRSLTYRIDSLPDTSKRKDRSKLTWGDFVDWSSDDIVEVKAPSTKEDAEAAKEWLRQVLSKGPIKGSKLVRMAEARGFSKNQLDRYARDINATCEANTWSI